MKIYVASSWRNEQQPEVVTALRGAGHQVYDFRNPAPENDGFRWTAIDPEWKSWSPLAFIQALRHPVAESGFAFDMNALRWCEVCVMVLPCGRSASLELGWAAGAGKRTIILLADGEPELMFKISDELYTNIEDVVEALK